MAVRHHSAIKAARQAEKRRERNRTSVNAVRSQIKRVLTAVSAKKADEAKTALREAVASLSKAVSKGIMKRNTVSRRVSRLTLKVNGLASQA